jgi:hypothetical protein
VIHDYVDNRPALHCVEPQRAFPWLGRVQAKLGDGAKGAGCLQLQYFGASVHLAREERKRSVIGNDEAGEGCVAWRRCFRQRNCVELSEQIAHDGGRAALAILRRARVTEDGFARG